MQVSSTPVLSKLGSTANEKLVLSKLGSTANEKGTREDETQTENNTYIQMHLYAHMHSNNNVICIVFPNIVTFDQPWGIYNSRRM